MAFLLGARVLAVVVAVLLVPFTFVGTMAVLLMEHLRLFPVMALTGDTDQKQPNDEEISSFHARRI